MQINVSNSTIWVYELLTAPVFITAGCPKHLHYYRSFISLKLPFVMEYCSICNGILIVYLQRKICRIGTNFSPIYNLLAYYKQQQLATYHTVLWIFTFWKQGGRTSIKCGVDSVKHLRHFSTDSMAMPNCWLDFDIPNMRGFVVVVVCCFCLFFVFVCFVLFCFVLFYTLKLKSTKHFWLKWKKDTNSTTIQLLILRYNTAFPWAHSQDATWRTMQENHGRRRPGRDDLHPDAFALLASDCCS